MPHPLRPLVSWQARASAVRPRAEPTHRGLSERVSPWGAWVSVRLWVMCVSFVSFLLQAAASVWTYRCRELERRVSEAGGERPLASRKLRPCAWR